MCRDALAALAAEDRRKGMEMMHRRSFLKGFGAALAPAAAFAQNEDPLQQLIQQNQRSDMGQGFDSASRTIQMPKASLPTLSPATVQHTELAMARYEQIVAAGGWPASDQQRNRTPSEASA